MSAFQRLAVGDRGRFGGVEDTGSEPPGLLGPQLRGVVHLLEDAGHGEDECRLEVLEIRHQVLDVGGVAHTRPGVYAAALDHAGEDVRQRKEQESGGLRVQHLGRRVPHGADLGQQVAVGEFAALWAAGGPGRVDDCGQAVCLGGLAPRLKVGLADGHAVIAQLVKVPAVDVEDALEVGELISERLDHRLVVVGLDKDRNRAGVAGVPRHLLCT